MRQTLRFLLSPTLTGAWLALLLVGCGSLGRTAGEVTDLIEMGGQTVLREPLRPIRGTTRVLLIGLDGVGDGALRDAIAQGDMPHLAALLGRPTDVPGVWDHAYAASDVTAVLPSETAVGWTTVFTGRPPAETGVPGNEWFARDSLQLFAPVPGSVSSVTHTVRVFTDDLLGQLIQTPTLFDRAGLRSHVSLGFVHHGADLLAPPQAADLGELADAATDALFHSGPSALIAELDEDTAEGVRAGVLDYGVPDLQVAYFPGPDLVAHLNGRSDQRPYLRDEVDPQLGAILDLYRDQDMLDSTYVVVVADHGHTPRIDDDTHALEAEDTLLKTLETSGVRARSVRLGDDETASYQAVVGVNEAIAFLYLADRSTCPEPGTPCDWTRPPRLDEDVLPIAQRLRQASDDAPGGPTLDLVLARASRLDASIPFQVLDGDRLVPVADYLARYPRPDLIRLEERLAWLTDGPLGSRAGDILLLTTATSAVPVEDRFYFGESGPSGHGGAGPLDSLIPLVVAHPGRTGTELQNRVRAAVGDRPSQLDVTPLVLSLLEEGGPLPSDR